jgi:hypothetical protein
MPLGTLEAGELLEGIKNHPRAGNFDLVSIQSGTLAGRMESAVQARAENSSELREALPAVQALILDGTRSDYQSVLRHADEAKDALGITPGATPAWPAPPGKSHRPAVHPGAPDVQPQVRHAPAVPLPLAPFPEVIDVNTSPAEEIRRVFGVDENVLRHILRHRPYRGWEHFSEKNPGFSEARLRSLRQAGVTISRPDVNTIV